MSMLSGTTLSALRVLLYLGRDDSGAAVPPRKIASELGESPTYLAKVTGRLVKAGILQSLRGVKGGVSIALPPRQITLLQIVNACQGPLHGGLCRISCGNQRVCAFHQAATRLEQCTTRLLTEWTLQRLLQQPRRERALRGGYVCLMSRPAEDGEGGRRVIP